MRREFARWIRGLPLVIATAVLGCGDDATGVDDLAAPAGAPVAITIELLPALPTFKVDGRLQTRYALAPPFAGTHDVGVLVLPAGERAATQTLQLPELAGTLSLREITTSPIIPFLCGSEGPLDPRVESAATVALDLCRP